MNSSTDNAATNSHPLPSNWVQTTLEEVVNPTRDAVQPKDYGDLPYIGMEHVESETTRVLGAAPSSTIKSAALRFYVNDVLYGRLRPYLNKVAQPHFDGLCSSEFIVFRKSEHIEPTYLRYFLNLNSFKIFASHLNTGDRPRVNWNQLKVFPFPLAPLNEQKRIAAKLEEAFSLLDANLKTLRAARQKVEAFRKATLASAASGALSAEWREERRARGEAIEDATLILAHILNGRRTRWKDEQRVKRGNKSPGKLSDGENRKQEFPSLIALDMSTLPQLPENWCSASIEQLASVKGGKRLPKGHSYSEERTPFPYLRVTDFHDGSIDISNLRYLSTETQEAIRQYTIASTDVYISIAGTIGQVGVVPEHLTGANLTENAAKITPEGKVSAKYLSSILRSPFLQNQISKSTVATSQPKLALFRILKLVVPLAPSEEQEYIVCEVERRLEIAARAEAAIDDNEKRVIALRQAMLRQAFSGHFVPQDPNDEPGTLLLQRIRVARKNESLSRQEAAHKKKWPPGTRQNVRNTQEDQLIMAFRGGKLSLVEVAKTSRIPLRPDQLFTQTGFDVSHIDEIEEFYKELHAEVQAGRLMVTQNDEGAITISVSEKERNSKSEIIA